MSKTVDERVVSMQFDNKNFEKNVQTSMSTLDKLKKSLKLDGAAKSLEGVSAAAKNVDVSPISKGVEAVSLKFSALQVMAVTALSNITNSAINTGKRLVEAFTIAPIKTGFNEFELKMGSIQTIMAGTGESLEKVNGYLDELNTYSDKTIYSFQDMTSNIGKFTNAGVKLDDAVMAIKGISNEAALSGANANEASRAMYNFAQALSAGYVKLIDWKSIELANMATSSFKQELIDTAVEMGTLTKVTDGYKTSTGTVITSTKNFNDSLQDQWMTTEVLVGTLRDYADETTDIGKRAYAAAQDVKTFSMMMDTLKEAAQSGWAQTWEIVVGDFLEGKTLWTELSETFGNMLGASANNRNAILEQGLGSNWDKLIKKINEAGMETDDFNAKLEEVLTENGHNVSELTEKYGSLGEAFTEGAVDSDLLKKALGKVTKNMADLSRIKDDLKIGKTGDDIKQAQKALKDLGYDLGEFGEKADGIDGVFGKVTESAVKAFQAANDLNETGIIDDKTLEALEKASSSTIELKENFDDLIESVTKKGGRDNLITALKNSLDSIETVLGTVKKAWNDVFYPGKSEDDIVAIKAERLYELTEIIKGISESLLEFNTANIDKLVETFTGLFSVLKIIRIVVGGPLTFAWKVFGAIISHLDLSLLDITSAIGRAITKFADWLSASEAVGKVAVFLYDGIVKIYEAVKKFIGAFVKMPEVSGAFSALGEGFRKTFSQIKEYFANGSKAFSEFLDRVKAMDKISFSDISAIFTDFVTNVIGQFFKLDFSFKGIKASLEKFKDSVSENFTQAGEKFSWLLEKIKPLIDFIRDKIPGAIAVGLGALLIRSISKLSDAFALLISPLEGVSKIIGGVAKVIAIFGESLKKFAKAKAFEARANGIKKLAEAILIIAAAIALLTMLDPNKMWGAVGAIAAIAVVIGGLSFAISKIKATDTIKLKSIGVMVLAIGVAMLLLSRVAKTLSEMSVADLAKGIIATAFLGGIITGLIAASKLAGKDIDRVGPMILKIGVAMLLLTFAVKMAGSMSAEDMIKGILVVGLLSGLVVGLIAASKLARGRNFDKAGAAILKVSVALLLLVMVAKIAGSMNPEDVTKGIIVIAALEVLIAGLILASRMAGEYTDKSGAAVFRISLGLMAMVGAIKIAASISSGGIAKGLATIAALEIMMAGIIAVSKKAGENSAKAGAMLLMMAGALLIMTGVIYLLKDIDPAGLTKALVAIGVMEAMFAGLIAVTHLAKDVKGTLIVLTVAVGVMAGVLIALAHLGATDVLAAGGALAMVVGVFGLLIAATSLISDVKWGRTAAILGTMLIVVGALAGIILALSKLEVGSTLEIAGSLSLLLLSLAGACAILSLVKGSVKNAALIAAAMTGVVIVLAGIVAAMSALPNVDKTLTIAESLSLLLLALSAACLILSKIGPLGEFAAKGALSLMGVLGIVAGVILAVGGIVAAIPGSSDFLDVMIEVLDKLGKALGSFFGGIVGGFTASAVSTLPEVGTCLTGFMTNAQGFFNGLKNVDKDAVDSCSNLIKVVGMMAKANLTEQFAKSFTGVGSADTFGENLTKFGTAIVNFSSIVSGNIDNEAVEAAAAAGEMVASLAKEMPSTEGLIGWITGKADMAEFGAQLVPFGTAMVRFSSIVSGKINLDGVEAASAAGEMMLALAKDLPNTEGLIGWITGKADMAEFGSQLVPFGTAMARFSSIVSGNIDTAAVENAKNAAEMMIALAADLPNTEGLIGWITGKADMSEFGAQLVPFGTAIARFSSIVSNGAVDSTAVENARNAAEVMSALAKELPENPTLLERIFGGGTMTMETFGSQLVAFGEGICDFSDAISGNIDTSAMTVAVEAIMTVVDTLNNAPKEFDLTAVTEGFQQLGQALVDLSDVISGKLDTDAIDTVATVGVKLAEMADTMPSTADFSPVITNLESFGKAVVGFSEAVSGNIDAKAITVATEVGVQIVDSIKHLPTGIDFTDFVTGLGSYGTAIVDFANNTRGLDVTSVDAAITVGSKLADMFALIPEYLNPTDFITHIGSIGTAIVGFSNNVVGLNTEKIWTAINVGTQLGTMLATIPDYVDPTDFITHIGSIGTAIVGFSTNVSGLETEKVYIAIGVGNSLGGMLANIPDYVDPTDFITHIGSIGTAIVGFSNNVANLNTEMIHAAIIAGTDLGSMLANIPTYVDPTLFITHIGSIGTAIVGFSNNVSGLSTGDVYSAIASCNALIELMNNMSVLGESPTANFVAGLTTLGQASVAGFISAFTTANADVRAAMTAMLDGALSAADSKKSNFTSAGESLIGAVTKSIEDASGSVSGAVDTVVGAASDSVDSEANVSSFYTAGENLAKGMASGIEDNEWRAVNAAVSMVESAIAAAKEAADENSPSKEFHHIGAFAAIGLANGIDDNCNTAVKASTGMGEAIVDALVGSKASTYAAGMSVVRTAMAGIGAAMSSAKGFDYQPTISPVLNMGSAKASDLKIGAGISMYLEKPVSSLSQLMSDAQSEINSSNQRVIDAVTGLREDLNVYASKEPGETALYVSGKKLASSISKDMNRELNILSKRGAY